LRDGIDTDRSALRYTEFHRLDINARSVVRMSEQRVVKTSWGVARVLAEAGVDQESPQRRFRSEVGAAPSTLGFPYSIVVWVLLIAAL